MRRREFSIGVGAALAFRPGGVTAEGPPRIVGWLGSGAPYEPTDSANIGMLRGLADTGYVVGRNLLGTYRFSEGHNDRLPGLAADLVKSNVELIAPSGNPDAALAAKAATATLPVVFITGSDPVMMGIVPSLAQPGSNITGVTLLAGDLNRKRIEVLTELLPDAKALGVLINPHTATTPMRIRQMQQAANEKELRIQVVPAGDVTEFEAAFAALRQAQVDGLVVMSDALFMSNRQHLIDLAVRHALPAIYETRDFAVRGGLIAYGANLGEVAYRWGLLIGKVLNGARPADLPVEQPVKFDLAINLGTAKALGLIVPPSILARAEAIE